MSDLTVAARHRRAPPRAARHRRDPAAAVLGVAHRAARLAAGRLRAGDRAGGRRGLVVRPGRLRRVGAGAVGRAAADQPGAPDRPRPGVGRGRRRAVGVERGRRRRGRAAGSRPTGRRSWSSRCCPSRAPTGAGAAAAPRVRARQAGRPRPAVRHRARASTRPSSTAPSSATTCWRRAGPATATGCATRPTTSPACSPRARTRSACSWPTAGTAATSASPASAQLYGDRTGAFVQLEVDHPDGSRTTVDHRRLVAVDPGADDPGRHLQRRDLRRPPRAARLVVGRLRRRRLDAGRGRRRSTSRRWSRPTGPPVRRTETLPGPRDHHLAVGQDAGRLRAEPGRPDPARAARRARPAPRSPSGTPRCSSTASSAPGRCARPTRPTSSCWTATGRGRWEPRFTFHGFRYAEVTGWPGELTADDLEAVVVHTDLRRTGTFTCSDPDVEPAARERRLGHARQLRRRARPTARSATSGSAGPATSQVFAPTASFLYDTAGMLALLAGRPRRRAARGPRRHRADVRAVPAAAAVPARRPTSAGATPPSSSRGCCTSAPATPGCSPTSGRA